jgi:hypothetical protein
MGRACECGSGLNWWECDCGEGDGRDDKDGIPWIGIVVDLVIGIGMVLFLLYVFSY